MEHIATVSIYCNHIDPNSGEQRETSDPNEVLIATLGYFPPPDPRPGVTIYGRMAWRVIDGLDVLEDYREYRRYRDQGMRDFRYNLHCPACGATSPRTRSKLDPVLDTLRDHGVPSVTMRGLAAIM